MRELEDNTMAKKHGLAKVVLGVGAAAVAGKVAFDKFKQTKERFAKEENDSFDDEIRKYNAIGEKKVIEVEDEVLAASLKQWPLRQYLTSVLQCLRRMYILISQVMQVQ